MGYYAEACNEWREPSPRLSAWATHSEETSQRWRAVGDTVSDLTDPGIEPKILRADSDVLTITPKSRVSKLVKW